jgi:hypothetical protein
MFVNYPIYVQAAGANAIAVMVEQNSFTATNVGGDGESTLLWKQGTSTLDAGQLLFTTTSNQAGSVVKRNQVKLSDGFSTYFQMSFSGPADGIAFILYKSDTPKLGDNGGALGYGDNDLGYGGANNTDPTKIGGTKIGGTDSSIHDSIIVEFDTWPNYSKSQDQYDRAADGNNHVAIMLDGNQVHVQQSDGGAAVFKNAVLSGQTINAWVDYSSGNGTGTTGTVTVTFGKGATKGDTANHTISRTIQVSDNTPIAGDNVFVGFTSSTGGNVTTHKLLKWYFKDSYVAGGLAPTAGTYTQAPATLSVVPNNASMNPTNAAITIKDASGIAMSNETFDVHIDGILIPEGTPGNYNTGAGTVYSFTIPSNLSNGSHTIRVAGQGGVTNFATFTVDKYAPNLTAGAVNRTSDTEGTVKFTSDEAGSYYYAIVADGAGEPAIDTIGAGTACTTGETIITNPTGLTAGAKDIYIKVKDAAGNVSTGLKIDIAAYVTPSSDAGLTSVLGQAVTAGAEAGTNAAPKTASISVANAVATVAAADIVKHDAGATVTFYGTDSTFATPEAGSVNLTAGSGTDVYIKVVAADSTPLYYKVSINRAAPLSSDAGLTSVLGQAITAGAEAGTSGAPKTASISVANAVSTVAAADIVKHDAGATVTFYGTDSTFATSEAGSVNLTAGSGTDVYIKVVAADSTPLYYKVTINRASAHSGGGSGGDSTPSIPATPTQPTETGFEILVNGKTVTAATATTTQEGDQTVTTVVVDDKKVEEKLQTEGNNATVTIPVKNDADVVACQLNGQTVKNMETKEAVLKIITGNVTYTLPASQINIDNASSQIGKQVELKDIKVNVTISTPPQDTVKIVENTANRNNYQVVVKPIEFNITCSSGNKTVEISKFNGYVERMVAIPEGIDPSKITTGIVLNSDGTFSHVPTVITIINGKYYAKINSLTNSTYSVIWSPKTFKDVEKHWAKDAVNDMGSRLIISGVGNDMFAPDQDITRGEFAAIVVRALGLMRPGTGKSSFGDVSKNDRYYDAVSIAYENGIISGYGNGKFGPMDKITREQAMTMIARAMKITGLKSELKDSEISSLLANYADGAAASTYTKTSIAACLKTSVITGRNGSTIAPRDYITRAEVAVIVQRLLKKSNLI